MLYLEESVHNIQPSSKSGEGGGGRELVLPSESKVIQERQNLLSLLHSFTSQIEAAQLFSKDILKGL